MGWTSNSYTLLLTTIGRAFQPVCMVEDDELRDLVEEWQDIARGFETHERVAAERLGYMGAANDLEKVLEDDG